MILLKTKLIMPEILYHGTTMAAIQNPNGFRHRLINEEFMKNRRSENRDFGTGFYTTVDFRQAALWARKSIVSAWRSDMSQYPENELPVILKIVCRIPDEDREIEVLDFRGESNNWSDFILLHRYQSRLNDCACNMVLGHSHPKIVCGPMADNDTGSVMALFKQDKREILSERDRLWFREEITQTEDGNKRVGLELGDQIAWFGEDLNNFLSLNGYFKINVERFLGDTVNETNYREEWDYHEGE